MKKTLIETLVVIAIVGMLCYTAIKFVEYIGQIEPW
jgi:Tfp pilus assembly protein PilE